MRALPGELRLSALEEEIEEGKPCGKDEERAHVDDDGKEHPRFAAFTANISGFTAMRLLVATFSISARISFCSSRVMPESASKAISSRLVDEAERVSEVARLSRSPSMQHFPAQILDAKGRTLDPVSLVGHDLDTVPTGGRGGLCVEPAAPAKHPGRGVAGKDREHVTEIAAAFAKFRS